MMKNLLFRSAGKLSTRLNFTRCISTQQRRVTTYRRILVPLTVGGGATFFGYHYLYKHPKIEAHHEKIWSDTDIQVNLYRLLPLNAASRLWGKINDIDLPVWMRSPLLGLYVRIFHCDLSEAANPNLKEYSNLGQFFRRRLKPACRLIDNLHPVVSPCDGTILSCGVVTTDQVEQVKGVVYTMSNFLGPQTFLLKSNPLTVSGETNSSLTSLTSTGNCEDTNYEENLKFHKNNNLYHCVIYLAPGDYHGFHSPADWTISYRRYFPGYLLSVNPRFAHRVPQLFNLNERVVYFGKWQDGFFSMALIGATNVGSVRIYCDRDLVTNNRKVVQSMDFDFLNNVIFTKGSPFGEFNLGSTIVLVFEAPKDFKFSVEPGQKIKFGEPLGS